MPSQQNGAAEEEVDGLPLFAGGQHEAREEEDLVAPETAPTPPNLSPGPPPPPPSAPTPPDQTQASTSSTGSTDAPDPGAEPLDPTEVDFAALGATLAGLAGMGINKAMRRKDELWLMTDDEAQGIGEALSNIVNRHAPDELTEGDGGDVAQIAVIAVNYTVRNTMGLSKSDPRLTGDVIDVQAHEHRPEPAAGEEQIPAGVDLDVMSQL